MPIPERLFEEKEREIETFYSVMKGENFITPNVEDFISIGKYLCELSSGYHIMGTIPVGVTVVNTETMEQEFDMSQVFFEKDYETAMKKARKYMATL